MVLGIDLGTTYSAISYPDSRGKPQIVLNREKEPTTPSLAFVEGDSVTVGKNARKKALGLPEKICRCVKRLMGFRETAIKEGDKSYSPEAVSAIIIRRLIEDALHQNRETIEGVVVTVPTYFNDAKRTATYQAVEAAVEAIQMEEMFPKKISYEVDPDKAVTFGAAIYAGMLLGKEEFNNIKLQDVCAHEIGILVMDEETGNKYNDVLIEKNTPVDLMAEREYQTAYEDQTYIKLELTESEVVISETDIKLPEQLSKGTKVSLRIRVNKYHLIEVFLRIPSIDFCKEYKVKRTQNLSEEEKRKLSGLVASRIIH